MPRTPRTPRTPKKIQNVENVPQNGPGGAVEGLEGQNVDSPRVIALEAAGGPLHASRAGSGGEIERVAVDSLQIDPANTRIHDERNIESIKASLARFGQQRPLIVDMSGVVRAGNGTLVAARSLGWATVLIRRTELTGAEVVAYAIADNRTAELAAWDESKLGVTLRALEGDPGVGLEPVGFTVDEVNALCSKLADDEIGRSGEGGSDGTEGDGGVKQVECPGCGHHFRP